MQLNITGHNVEITPAMREFVTAKFSKLEQFFDRINQVYIVLKVEKVTQNCGRESACQRWRNPCQCGSGRICMRLSMVLSTSWQDS